MPSITYEATVGPNPTQYYGTLIVKNLKYSDGNALNIKTFLGVNFKSPASLDSTAFNASVNPWQNVTAAFDNAQIDSSTYSVVGNINFEKAYTINPSDTFTFGINGDLTSNQATYTGSFVFEADALPDVSGTVNIQVASAPDSAFASSTQSVTFSQGGLTYSTDAPIGKTTPFKVPAGKYSVVVDDLTTSDETVVAAASVSPSSVQVATGASTSIKVTYGTVQKFSAIDIVIGDVGAISDEQLHVTVVDTTTGQSLADFLTASNVTTSLRRLPVSGSVSLSIDSISLNNVLYAFARKNLTLQGKLITVSLGSADIQTSPVNTTGFVKLPIVVSGSVSVSSNITFRLTSATAVYTQAVAAKAGTTPFAVPVAPGTYTVSEASFIVDATVYVAQAPSSITVAKDGSTSLAVELLRGANLNVKGFPNFLSFGGIADLTPGNQADFVAAKASSIFKYAGFDGAGDAGGFLSSDSSTSNTLSLARSIETELGKGYTVLPILISYTVNLSLGDTEKQLQNTDGLGHSFANLILALNLANKTIDADHPVPAGFIVNPDFLGEAQRDIAPTYVMPVRTPLQTALDHWSIKATIPSQITDTASGYVLAVNWLVRTVAPAVTFGWQINVWGGGSATWIYNTGAGNNDPVNEATKTVQYIKSLGAYSGQYAPDFLAIDRYEADDWTQRSYINGYFYGPYEWRRYYDFVKAVSTQLQVPVAPWQIPTSRAPLVSDVVQSNFDPQHWGTGGSYLLGDGDVNSSIDNINSSVLDIQLNATLIQASTAREVWQRGQPFDLTQPAYSDFPLRGIFTVLLGGGSTTGIISSVGNAGPWVTDRLNAYRQNPIYLSNGATASKAQTYAARIRL